MSERIINEIKMGTVRRCLSLNVRKDPSLGAEIVGEIFLNSEVEVDLTQSTEDFYKVCTVSGLEGFCMRKYIKVSS